MRIELGSYRELTFPSRELGIFIFMGMLTLTALLERLQFRLKDSEASVWWASNGRDVVNALALAAMMLGLVAIGFSGPIALAVASTLVIALAALEASLPRRRYSWVLTLAGAWVVGISVLVFPQWVHESFRVILEGLFTSVSARPP
jgi:hypothetical protein